ncbi:MAG: hypothetical protein IKM23_02775 [Bacteroidales bacterium]|nr:hypothetical protein [Bacteroidales bacterium]
MNKITTISQLEALQSNTMVYAVIVCLTAVLVAFIISLMIPYKGGVDKSYVKRRIAYIIVGIVASVAFFLFNELYVMNFIMNAGFQTEFAATNLQCLGITIGGYIIVGLVIMIAFRHSKFGSILGKVKE